MHQADMFPVTSSSPLIGASVFLDRRCDQRKPCCCNIGLITIGSGPHAAGLICDICGRHRGWLSHNAVQRLHEVIERFGAPTEPLTLRHPSSHFASCT
jgi:hypothetical protein